MSTFQIVISLCLLTFLLVTGCNDMTQTKAPGLNAKIIKEIQDSETDMAKNSEQAVGMTTTVEIVRKESLGENGKIDAPAENQTNEQNADQSMDNPSADAQDKVSMEQQTDAEKKLAQAGVTADKTKEVGTQAVQ